MNIIATEYQECLSYFRWTQFNPILREVVIKIVNEGKRSSITGNRLKLIGLRAGLPDYLIPIANNKYSSLWLEMKRKGDQNKKKRENQNEWLDRLNKLGHYASYCYGWEHAAEVTRNYLGNKL